MKIKGLTFEKVGESEYQVFFRGNLLGLASKLETASRSCWFFDKSNKWAAAPVTEDSENYFGVRSWDSTRSSIVVKHFGRVIFEGEELKPAVELLDCEVYADGEEKNLLMKTKVQFTEDRHFMKILNPAVSLFNASEATERVKCCLYRAEYSESPVSVYFAKIKKQMVFVKVNAEADPSRVPAV